MENKAPNHTGRNGGQELEDSPKAAPSRLLVYPT